MTNHTNPFDDVNEAIRRQVRRNPEEFAAQLAEQHFNEALDNLQEVAREVLDKVIHEDLRMSIAPDKFEAIFSKYTENLSLLIKQCPTTLEEG